MAGSIVTTYPIVCDNMPHYRSICVQIKFIFFFFWEITVEINIPRKVFTRVTFFRKLPWSPLFLFLFMPFLPF